MGKMPMPRSPYSETRSRAPGHTSPICLHYIELRSVGSLSDVNGGEFFDLTHEKLQYLFVYVNSIKEQRPMVCLNPIRKDFESLYGCIPQGSSNDSNVQASIVCMACACACACDCACVCQMCRCVRIEDGCNASTPLAALWDLNPIELGN